MFKFEQNVNYSCSFNTCHCPYNQYQLCTCLMELLTVIYLRTQSRTKNKVLGIIVGIKERTKRNLGTFSFTLLQKGKTLHILMTYFGIRLSHSYTIMLMNYIL